MADAQTTERDLDQADQRTDSRFEEQQRETVRQGQQLIAIEKLIAQNDKHHKDRMARYEANQEKVFEQLEARIEQNDKYHKDRMAHYEANQEKMFGQLEARIEQNDKYHKDRMARYEANQEKVFGQLEARIAQNDKYHKDHMARYEANQEKIFERLETRIEQNTTKITENKEQVIRLDTLIEQHDDRMSRLSEIQRELRATMQSNFNWIIGVVLGGVFLILGTLVTGFFALPK